MARGAVRVSITADTSDLKRGLATSERSLASFSRSGTKHFAAFGKGATGASGGLSKLAKAASAAGAGYLAISAAKSAVDTTLDLGRATKSLNQNLGISVKQASEWASVAKVRGVESKQLIQSFGTLARQEKAATDGTKTAVDGFKALGISQKELKDQNFQQTLGEVSDGLLGMKDKGDRAALTMKLFGRGWQTVVPILRDGSKAMKEQLELANHFGATFGGKTLRSVDDLREAQRKMAFATLGLQIAFSTQLAPALSKIIPSVAEFVNNLRQGKGTAGQFGSAIGVMANAFKSLAKHKGLVLGLGIALTAATAAWAAYKIQVAAAAVATTIATGGLNLIIPALVAVGAAFGVAYSSSSKFRRIVDGAFQATKKAAMSFLRTIGNVIAGFAHASAAVAHLVPGMHGVANAMDKAGDKADRLGEHTKRATGYLDKLTGRRWPVSVDLRIGAKTGIQGFKPLQPLDSLGRQVGGMIPGWGDGDKVPVLAEPGEGFINKRAVQAIGGPQAIDAINRAVPRFQRGGAVDTWRLGANSAGGTNQIIKNNRRVLQNAFGGGGGPAGMVAAANMLEKAHFPYLWGGGHQATPAPFGPMDCSGAVSFVLQHGGVNIPTMVSGALAGAGQPGPGRVTVFANDTHTFMRIGNRYFGTSGSNPGGGAGWFPDPGEAYRSRFTQRHFGASAGPSRATGPPRGRGDAGDAGPRGGPHQRGGAHFRRGGMVGFQNGGMVKALHALHRAGATGAEEATLGAIAGAESGWRFVRGDGGQSWSPWQIYQPSWGDTIKRLGINIGTWGGAAKMALYIARNSGYDSWTTFRNGAYRPFLSRVERDISGGRNTGRIRGARPKKKKITPAQQRRLDRQSRRRSRARTGAEGLDPWFQAFDQNIQYKLAQAELTPRKDDDIRVQSEAIGGYQGFLNVAKRRHDQQTATLAAQSLKAARDARDELLRGDDTAGGGGNPLADALGDLAEQTKGLKEITTERAAFEKSIAYTSKEVAIKALSDVISGQIGGFTNQRRATAGDGATVARY